MKRVTTKITYKVPAWEFCNHQSILDPSRPTNKICRFCVAKSKGVLCILYNEWLQVYKGIMYAKPEACYRATAGFNSVVEDIDPMTDMHASIDSTTIIKNAVESYIKIYKQLIEDGYHTEIAEKVAKDMIEGELRDV